MNKLFSVFIIIVLLLCGTGGFLFYENGNLHNQVGVFEEDLSECQNQSLEYENEINVLESQIDELENQSIELQSQFDQLTQLRIIKNTSIAVRVTDFTIPGFSPMVGTWVESYANITIQNFGTNDLEGLTLTIDNPDDYPQGSIPKSLKIESLNAGEERTVSTNVYWELGEGIKFVIRIKLDDIILHEYSTY